jgi:hypothetical protein
MKNSNDTIGNRSRDLPVSSVVPQPLHHRVPLLLLVQEAILPLTKPTVLTSELKMLYLAVFT